MNITPALPNPYQPAAQQARGPVAPVQAAQRTRDATDDAERRPTSSGSVVQVEHERLRVSRDTVFGRHPDATARAHRAVAAYAAVSDSGERSSLRDLLGFDAYA
ncbi:MAG: hypothetical protein H6961_00490 [Chromatiaceae bacterium]|nr:hypothetical protein [Gammaproteobacteria bacterium]MCP5413088.1 hypothetical protein [Chromatiaceae bacterium]MCP5436582.1 hypothetical protein [Chromatiaceae bacterium]MCP5440414.1 hypothetical protein [Chromatiaceae bacterium]